MSTAADAPENNSPDGVAFDRPRAAGWARYSPLAVWAALGAALGYVLIFPPTQPKPFGGCLWYALLGVTCPLCGGTRMFHYLIHGDLVESARHHLVALVGLLYGFYALIAWTAGRLFARRLPLWRPSRRAVIIYGVVLVGYAVVLRNLPWMPLSWFDIESY